MKYPYTFPARSRAAMVDYIAQDWRSYGSHHDRYLFAWNVKVHLSNEQLLARAGEYETRADLDEQWTDYLEGHPDLIYSVMADAAGFYTEGLYTSYPGSDQGDFKFNQCGRSGGYLALAEWRGHNFDRSRGYDKSLREDAIREVLEDWDFKTLRAFYKAVRCMDQDLTQEKAAAEVSYQLNFHRGQWEETIDATETDAAHAMEDARPDMYGEAQ